jgi:micrococcal nuclease
MKLLIGFLFCFFGFSFSEPIPHIEVLSKELKAEVIGIQDGDTIELKLIFDGYQAKTRKGKPLRIRFQHIDCQEKGEPFYQKAKQRVSKLCFRKKITVMHAREFDRYGRLIGEVILEDGQNLNKILVKEGLATHYKKYSSSFEYALLERKAKNARIGIWSLN